MAPRRPYNAKSLSKNVTLTSRNAGLHGALMSITDLKDVAALKRVGAAVALARDTMGQQLRPGMTTRELDEIGREVLTRAGARSAPQLAYRFPACTCISVNDEVAHGVPSNRVLREGDLVNVDVSAELDGYWADTGASFAVGTVSAEHQKLLASTRAALADALHEVKTGAPLRNIGRAVETRARQSGFRVIDNLSGHGVGRFIHEKPDVPNTFDRRNKALLTEGLVIAIEPFLSTGATSVYEALDGWTLKTPDGSVTAQFEHTVIVTANGPLVITATAA